MHKYCAWTLWENCVFCCKNSSRGCLVHNCRGFGGNFTCCKNNFLYAKTTKPNMIQLYVMFCKYIFRPSTPGPSADGPPGPLCGRAAPLAIGNRQKDICFLFALWALGRFGMGHWIRNVQFAMFVLIGCWLGKLSRFQYVFGYKYSKRPFWKNVHFLRQKNQNRQKDRKAKDQLVLARPMSRFSTPTVEWVLGQFVVTYLVKNHE